MRKIPTQLVPIMFGTLILSGCGDSELQILQLKTSQVATAVNRNYHHHEDPFVNCKATRNLSCYGRAGVSPDGPGGDPVAVGLFHDYASATFSVAGVGLQSCNERINCVYRGLVMFDLSTLPSPKVVNARLRYKTLQSEINSAVTKWTEHEDCIAKIGYVLSPWGGFDLPAEFYEGDVSTSGFRNGLNVTATVRDWVTGAKPNHGFIMIGPNESIPKNDDDKCIMTLSDILLDVEVNVK
jgi:hypothetical protein